MHIIFVLCFFKNIVFFEIYLKHKIAYIHHHIHGILNDFFSIHFYFTRKKKKKKEELQMKQKDLVASKRVNHEHPKPHSHRCVNSRILKA